MSSKGILILGMHRSGTSAITGVLWRLGVHLSNNLIPGNQHNETGYWESIAINAQMERLLQIAKSRWHDWRPLNLEAAPPDALNDVLHQLILLVQTEGRDARLFGVKDPRICRSVPLWLEIMKKCQREPVAVIVSRHPLEVARSLAKRDGMPIDKGLLLWLRHLLDAERETRCIPRVFVQYHHIIENWRLVADRIASALEIQWPDSAARAESAIDQFLKPGLRHWIADDAELEEVAGAPWFKNAWNAFCSSADDQFRRDDVFDRIGIDADAGMRPFEKYFGLIETSLELAQHQAVQAAAALDKAKWLLGSSVIENSQPIKPWAEPIKRLEEKLEYLERRLKQLESGSKVDF